MENNIKELTNELKKKYREMIIANIEINLKKHEKNINQNELERMMNIIELNMQYIEKYLMILQIKDEDEMKKEIEKNEYHKELCDALYKEKEKENIDKLIKNSKIEIIE